MEKLHLYFDTHLNGYCVQLAGPGMFDASYTLGIIADWDEGLRRDERAWKFKRIAHVDGEWEEIYTGDEMEARLSTIAEHEGEACAKFWRDHQTCCRVGHKRELEMFAKASRRFLAFAELGLSLPVIHGDQFKNPAPAMSEADLIALNALRDAEFRRELADEPEFVSEIGRPDGRDADGPIPTREG